MATQGSLQQRFAERIYKHSQTRKMKEKSQTKTLKNSLPNMGYRPVPGYSRLHGQVPRSYTQEWKTDMKNRELIIKNAELGGISHYEHDEPLFLDKREQMSYNVENRNRVDSKCKMPARSELLRPPFHHESSKYQSELMFRRDEEHA